MNSLDAVTQALGERISGYRIARNLKQSELAIEAGINRTTLSRLEKGKGTIDSLIRVLMALGIESRLLDVVPNANINPLDVAPIAGKQRQRVRKPTTSGNGEDSAGWSWGEE